ncbi:MAG: DUF2147 domain-containing protein [Bacteroidales bacterium]|nr:DUF2147 domain-containing protein [Bacteroidales bacterium]MDZ4205344.1 DUF2147 domain-containing protein [Bacteroidales bacterium]
MKKVITFLVLAVLVSIASELKAQADMIVGYYLTVDDESDDPRSQVRIFKATNGKYYGEIIWLRDPLNDDGTIKVDDKNPDPKMHTRKIQGLQILKDFTYDASKNEWSGGSIYSPTSGKTYKSYLKFEGDNNLKVRGYIGSAWMGLGKTVYWKKEQSRR